MNKHTSIDRLKRIREHNREKAGFVNIDLYKLMCKFDFLVAGYEKIKSKKGSTTPAVGTSGTLR